jgi:hypothetical protein
MGKHIFEHSPSTKFHVFQLLIAHELAALRSHADAPKKENKMQT